MKIKNFGGEYEFLSNFYEVAVRADGDAVKISFMRDIVFVKFIQNPKLAEKLSATGNAEIVESNYCHDTFWSVDEEPAQT